MGKIHFRSDRGIKGVMKRAPKKDLSEFRPLEESSFLSLFTVNWVTQFVSLCYAKKKKLEDPTEIVHLEYSDIFSLPKKDESRIVTSTFEELYEKHAGPKRWKDAAYEAVKAEFFTSLMLQILATVIMTSVPFVTSKVVDSLLKLDKLPSWQPYVFGGVIMSLLILQSHVLNYGITFNSRAANRFACGVTGAVCRKLLKLSAASRQKFGGGVVANLTAVDPMRLNLVILLMPMLLVGPFQILAAIGLLSYFVGWAALAGLVVIILYIPIQFHIANKLDVIREVCSLLFA
jgi:ABC-type multidrug transport system fused ATPase/permease subunit